ncbi:MAG: hypothetical protein AAF481_15200 [Acidobacteriota bacterium]
MSAAQLDKQLTHAIHSGLASEPGGQAEQSVNKALDTLRSAREAAAKEDFPAAEQRLSQAAIQLDQAIRSRNWKWHARRHGLWEVTYLAPMVLVTLAIALGWRPLITLLVDDLPSTIWTVPLAAFGWGAFGALLRSLYWIARKVGRGTYLPQFALGHFCAPFIGALFGAFVFLLLEAGLFVLTGAKGSEIENEAAPMALAFLSGFNWQTVLDWVKNFRIGAAPTEKKTATDPDPLDSSKNPPAPDSNPNEGDAGAGADGAEATTDGKPPDGAQNPSAAK